MGLLLDAFELRPAVDFYRRPIEPLSCLEEDGGSHDWYDSDSDNDYNMDIDEDSDYGELIWDGVASTVRKIDDVRVVKSASTFKKYVSEPHDILKECSILSSLSHPNIIPFIYSENDEDERLLSFAMPYIPFSLTDLLTSPLFSSRQCPSLDSTLYVSWDATIFSTLSSSICFQLLLALDYLHEHSVSHRDIKPANVLLSDDCCVTLIDLGVSYAAPQALPGRVACIWPEKEDHMYFEVSTGPYRAPELLLGLRSYDAPAIDMWSFGAVFAEFFSAMYCIADDGYREEPVDIDPYIKIEDDNSNPFEISSSVMNNPEDIKWDRKSLFNGSRGEIGLIGSIFKIRGTPTEETWPEFSSLTSMQFNVFPPVPLGPLLPNLPAQSSRHLDLLNKCLSCPPSTRIGAKDALKHPVFNSIVLPLEYPLDKTHINGVSHGDLGSMMKYMLGIQTGVEDQHE